MSFLCPEVYTTVFKPGNLTPGLPVKNMSECVCCGELEN